MHRNKSKKKFDINKVYANDMGRLGLSFFITMAIMVIVFLFVEPVFMTIDDARLLYVYAGYATGVTEANYLFSYYPLGWLLSNLYSAFPQISWYAIYHFTLICLSSCLIGKTIYKIGLQKNIKIVYLAIIHVFLYLSFYLISTILMHFEVTATIIGTAGVILLLGIDFKNSKKRIIIFELLISVFCIALCYIQQFNAFYAICCYLLVAIVYIFLHGFIEKNLSKVLKYCFVYLLFLSLILLFVKGIEDKSKSSVEWQEYYKYNKYRVSFWDYEHEAYEDNPDLFDKIGWSEEFYQLSENMYFMDKRFNKENLGEIVEKFSWFELDEWDKLLQTWKTTLRDLLTGEKLTLLHIYIVVILFIVFIKMGVMRTYRKLYYPQIIAALCCVLGTLLVISYLAARGRLPLRAWLASLIPCGIIVSVLFLMTYDKTKFSEKKIQKLCIALLLCIPWGGILANAYTKIYNVDWQYRQNSINIVGQIENYALEHSDNVYVFDQFGAQNYGVFTNYPDPKKRPVNLVPWGSSYVFTPTYYKQLEYLGKDTLLTENLFDEDVYYVTSYDSAYKDLLSNMLNQEYDHVEFREAGFIGDAAIIYKISKE